MMGTDLEEGAIASWADFEAAAPDLAAAIRSKFESNVTHIIGTIRPNDTPRLSGTEVQIVGGQLTLGMMVDSRKLDDVCRDPRVEIYCAPVVSSPNGHDAYDAKIAGRLVATGPTEGQPGTAFRLEIRLASRVGVEGDELVLHVWRPGHGLREIRRH